MGDQILQFSDAGIVCGKVQLFPKLFFYDGAGSEPGLCGSLICTDETSGAEQGTAEITCDNHDAVVDFFPEQYVQDWTAGSAGWFSVIAAAGTFIVASDGVCVAVVSCIPVFFFDLI